MPHLQVGYNPFTNHFLTSWDIQVSLPKTNIQATDQSHVASVASWQRRGQDSQRLYIATWTQRHEDDMRLKWHTWRIIPNSTLPETNSSSLKVDGWKMNFLLGRPIFRGYVSFREGSN